MACPFFVPLKRLDRDRWLHAPRLPLGNAFHGICHSGPEPFVPPEAAQEELCNCGYARGRCDRFPADGTDAVRFSIISRDSRTIRVIYILERNHAPETHGLIEFFPEDSRFEPDQPGILQAQALAFIESGMARISAGAGMSAAAKTSL